MWRASIWCDENCSVSCVLHTPLRSRTSLSLLISLASQHMKFQHVLIEFQTYSKWNTVTKTDTAGEVWLEKNSAFFLPSGKNQVLLHNNGDSRPESPRKALRGLSAYFCASVARTISGDFSSQSPKCMQIKLWHKQALEDEHCSSKKPPSSPIEQTACFSC